MNYPSITYCNGYWCVKTLTRESQYREDMQSNSPQNNLTIAKQLADAMNRQHRTNRQIEDLKAILCEKNKYK